MFADFGAPDSMFSHLVGIEIVNVTNCAVGWRIRSSAFGARLGAIFQTVNRKKNILVFNFI